VWQKDRRKGGTHRQKGVITGLLVATCKKRKASGTYWEEREVRLERQSLNFYGGGAGSSVKDLTGCLLEPMQLESFTLLSAPWNYNGGGENGSKRYKIVLHPIPILNPKKSHKIEVVFFNEHTALLFYQAILELSWPQEYALMSSIFGPPSGAATAAGGTAGGRSLAAAPPEGQCARCGKRPTTGKLTGIYGLRKPYQFCCVPCEKEPGGFVNHTEECETRYSGMFDPF